MQSILEELGLSDKEAKLYLRLLREKSATASRLAKLTKINRTTVYLELNNLLEQGLVSYVIKDAKRYYQAAPPEKFIDNLELKKTKLAEVIPAMNALHKSPEPFKISVYEGKEGIKTFYNDVIRNAKEILVFGATGRATEVLRFSYPHVAKKALEAGITERALANANARSVFRKHEGKKLQVKYLPKRYSASVTTVIYAGKVAIQSLQQENVYVVVMEDKGLYQSYKAYFEFMWKLSQ